MAVIEIREVLCSLARQRRLFHSEADFQHALAWEIRQHLPNASVRLEFPLSLDNQQIYLDIWVRQSNANLLIELKYKTRALDFTVGNEKYALKSQGAQDIGRYDFVKDVHRLEAAVAGLSKSVGYAILLTNDSAYWKRPRSSETVDADFRLHDGRTLQGNPAWQGAGEGTMRGRESAIALKRSYSLKWYDYSTLGVGGYDRFRYLSLTVVP